MTEVQDNTSLEAGERRSGKGGAGKLIIVVIVLTVLAILLVPSQETPEKGVATNKTAPQERPSLLAEDKTRQAATAVEKETGRLRTGETVQQTGELAAQQDVGPGAAARRLIRELRSQTPLDLERAYKAAQDFQSKQQLDDAYLMYFFAAREGHGAAAMALARQADPASFSNNSLFDAPDELQANKWYSLAAQAGIADASGALEKLRSAVENKARAGDERARRIMLQWK